jgi:hypothetical protein
LMLRKYHHSLLKGLLLLAVASLALCSSSCKKIIMDAMTNGRWYVELYTSNTLDLTSQFSGYEFQFYDNGNVDGIINNQARPGTWTADISNYTITANFPASSGDTLKLLNYTWKLTDSYLDYVEAKTSLGVYDNILHLRKKP